MDGAGRPQQCGRTVSLLEALWGKGLAAIRDAMNALPVEGAAVALRRFSPDADGAAGWVNHMSIHPRPNAYRRSRRSDGLTVLPWSGALGAGPQAAPPRTAADEPPCSTRRRVILTVMFPSPSYERCR